MTLPDGRRPVVWFIDTASLISMAIDPQIEAVVRAGWPWLSTEWIDADAVGAIQVDVADGHPLDVRFLTEDFNARRVANTEASMTPLSLHRLFHNRVHRDVMPASEAARLSALLEKAGRGQDMTEEDVRGPARRLGRPGWP